MNLEDDMKILYKTLKSHNIYNIDERQFYNGMSNSFTDFIKSLTGSNIKSLSPRIIQKIRNKYYITENKNILSRLKSFKLKNNSPRSPCSPSKILRTKKYITTVITV